MIDLAAGSEGNADGIPEDSAASWRSVVMAQRASGALHDRPAPHMVRFDDAPSRASLTVYYKEFDEKVDTYREYITRSGDRWSPALPEAEPLRLECPQQKLDLDASRRSLAAEA